MKQDTQFDNLIMEALREDMPDGDLSSMYLFKEEQSSAKFIAKEEGVISGINLCKRAFELVDPNVRFESLVKNGEAVQKGQIIAMVHGLTKSLLMGERVALNFLQRMSGIASMTRKFVEKTAGTSAQILDTRKTTPLLRLIEKQAVLDGGAKNHRMSLSDMVMLKDNHLKAAKSIMDAVVTVKANIPATIKIEVEVETVSMFEEAVLTPCDIIMLDNMSLQDMAKCVELNQHRKKLEASGNMTLERIEHVANTGVDYISVGALTHSYKSMDISLKFV